MPGTVIGTTLIKHVNEVWTMTFMGWMHMSHKTVGVDEVLNQPSEQNSVNISLHKNVCNLYYAITVWIVVECMYTLQVLNIKRYV